MPQSPYFTGPLYARMAVYFWTVYSLGLRMQEGLNLQVGDIDAERGMVHVHRGKGAKDRYIPLPTSTLQLLRQYWKYLGHSSLQTTMIYLHLTDSAEVDSRRVIEQLLPIPPLKWNRD